MPDDIKLAPRILPVADTAPVKPKLDPLILPVACTPPVVTRLANEVISPTALIAPEIPILPPAIFPVYTGKYAATFALLYDAGSPVN